MAVSEVSEVSGFPLSIIFPPRVRAPALPDSSGSLCVGWELMERGKPLTSLTSLTRANRPLCCRKEVSK